MGEFLKSEMYVHATTLIKGGASLYTLYFQAKTHSLHGCFKH